MFKPTIVLTLTLALGTLAMSGCETGDDNTLASSQACLDSATTAAQSDQCVAMVQGLTSPEAALIRCSANFVAQGFTASKLASAITKLKNNSGSGQTTAMMSYLVFQNMGANNTADMALANCQASGVTSMIRLATAAQIATTIAGVGGISPTDPNPSATLTAIIASYSGSAAQNTTLGNTAIVAQQAYCGSNSTYSTTQVCTVLNNAVNGGGTPAQIGANLVTQLQTH